MRNELLQKKVVVRVLPVGGVDEEAAASFRSGHDEVADLVSALKVFDQPPPAAAHERLLVLAKTVQEVEHGVLLGFLVVICGKHYAVADGPVQNSAIEDGAIDTALRPRDWYQSQK